MTDIDIHGLKAAAQKLSLPLSPSWMAGGIRHLDRNVDCDAFWNEPEGGDGFAPGRYEGETMATVLNAVPALIERLEAAEARADGMERAGAEQARRANENAEVIRQLRARMEKLEAVAEAASPFASSNAGGLEARLAQALAALEAP